MKPKNIFIVRHGESEGNADHNIYCSKPDYSLRLTEKGIKQAIAAGKKLKSKIKHQTVGIYYSSFFRAIETLNHIGESLPTVQIKFVREDVRLIEQEWYGQLNPQLFRGDLKSDRDKYSTFYYRFDSGESCADVYNRLSTLLDTLHRDFEKEDFPENIIFVTHGMTMRVLLMRWFHKTVAEFETWEKPDNCQIYNLKLDTATNKYVFNFDSLKKRNVGHNYTFCLSHKLKAISE